MAADLATLALVVTGDRATQTIKTFDAATVRSGQSADALTAKLKAQDVALRRMAEGGAMQNETLRSSYVAQLRQNGVLERYRQIEQQVAQEMRVADQVAQQQIATTAKLTTATDGSHVAIGRLRQGFSSLGAQLANVHPIVGQMAGVLGSFAVGSALTVGILAGLAAVALAYNKLGGEAKEAKKQVDELSKSLQAQAAAARPEQVQAAERLADIRKGLAAARQREAELSRPALTGGGVIADATANFVISQRLLSVQKDIVQLVKDQAEAERKLRVTHGEKVEEERKGHFDGLAFIKELSEARKKAADEEKRADDAALARLNAAIAARIQLLSKIKIDFGGNQGAFDRIGQPGASEMAGGAGGMSLDELQSMFANYHKRRAERRDDVLAKEQKETAKHIGDLGKSAANAAQTISQALEYYLVSKLGGGSVGGSFGAAGGKAFASTLGGFGGTAAGQALFGPILAGAGAYLGNVATSIADDLFGLTGAASAAAKALREMQKSVDENLATFHARATGTEGSTARQIEEAKREADRLREQAASAFPGSGPWWAPNAGGNPALDARMKQIAEDEARYIALLEKEQALKKQYYAEDLGVRLLKAQGKDKEADALKLRLDQERERAALIASFGEEIDAQEAATLALLDTVLSAEKLKKTFDELTTSARNAPSGFKLERYIYEFAQGRQGFPSMSIPYSPIAPSGMPPKTGANTFNVTGPVYIDARTKTPKQAFNEWSREFGTFASATVGPNTNPAEALGLLPS